MSYTYLIVDDERLNRNFIRNLILDFEPASNVYDARSVVAAKEILDNAPIDILFLDIKMPEADGFDLLKLLPERNFELIFVTAYNNHAIEAIREGAVDYILKPIKIPEFQQALYRTIDKIRKKKQTVNTPELSPLDKLLNQNITIKTQKGTLFVSLRSIVYIEADNTYTIIHLSDGKKMLTSKPILKFEETLDPCLFFRIHKSYIINRYHFREIISSQGDWAIMDEKVKLAISRYRIKAFVKFLETSIVN